MRAYSSTNDKFIDASNMMSLYVTGPCSNEELVLEALDLFDEIIEEDNPWTSDFESDEDSGERPNYWRGLGYDDSSDEDVEPDSKQRDESAVDSRASKVWRHKYDLTLQWEVDCVRSEDSENDENSISLIEDTAPMGSNDFSFPILKLPLELRDKIYATYLEMDIDESASPVARKKRNSPTHSMAVYRLEPDKIEARQDTNDNAYMSKSSLRELLTSSLLQSCQQIREEVLAVFYRHTQFILGSIPDLNVFIHNIGHHGQQLLRHIQFYDPLYSFWPEDSVTQVLKILATSCPNLKTFRIQLDEEDMLFSTLRDDVESIPEHSRQLGRVLQNPRIAALLQLRPKVETSFQVEFLNKRQKDYKFLSDDHQLEELPHWIGRFYMSSKVWSDMLEEWQQ